MSTLLELLPYVQSRPPPPPSIAAAGILRTVKHSPIDFFSVFSNYCPQMSDSGGLRVGFYLFWLLHKDFRQAVFLPAARQPPAVALPSPFTGFYSAVPPTALFFFFSLPLFSSFFFASSSIIVSTSTSCSLDLPPGQPAAHFHFTRSFSVPQLTS
ncbi:hypothetical protein HDV57DRAFT_351171 [Trichoderma longibrachiatum]|uniref:Uncharacterized protein n=1 Tax=Trichoderma longibrachiatum ATCC 18648 TaxID=983965 RepID=A0A2T4BR90_TRILO|nr:hypothetical protein M440DRAFT_205596 [Trichoderma longibrachiatum ATCC 18648]